LNIRDAQPEERETDAAVIRAAYAEYERLYPPDVWPGYARVVSDVHGLHPEAQLIVAESDGRIVGTVTFFADGALSRQGEWPEGWAGLARLGVAPEQRGGGFGRALVEECIRRAGALERGTIGLHTTEWMETARAMYERMGFVRTPAFDFHPRRGVVGMGYRLDLRTR
jgi:GNAT superfamily N-acetyltransferase